MGRVVPAVLTPASDFCNAFHSKDIYGMTKIPLAIQTRDRFLAFEIVGSSSLQVGMTVPIMDTATLTFEGSFLQKAADLADVLSFVIDATINIELNLIAAWLYEKLRGKSVEQVKIGTVIITEITEEKIRVAITQYVETK